MNVDQVYRSYEGPVELMFGPRRYGYVDPCSLYYGEKGGVYLLGTAVVSLLPYTEKGHPRLPVWSDEKDDIVVACPRALAVEVIEENRPDLNFRPFPRSLCNEPYFNHIWVHRVSRDPDDWRHEEHPRARSQTRRHDNQDIDRIEMR